jgi:hypothetical protein
LTEKGNSSSSTEDLTGKLDHIIERLDFLEKLILEKPEYAGLVGSLELTKLGVGLYGESLKMVSRVKAQQNELQARPAAEDKNLESVIEANLIARQREVYCGENVHLEIHIANLGSGAVLLVKVEGIIPDGFDLVEKPEKSVVQDGSISLGKRKLAPLDTTEIKLTLKTKKKGEFFLTPRLHYADQMEKNKCYELEHFQIRVKELGIRGWLKGE